MIDSKFFHHSVKLGSVQFCLWLLFVYFSQQKRVSQKLIFELNGAIICWRLWSISVFFSILSRTSTAAVYSQKLSKIHEVKYSLSKEIMDWLHNLLTYIAIVLLIAVSLSSISPRWDYRVKNAFLYFYFLLSSLIVIPFGLVIRDPIKTGKFWCTVVHPISKLLNLRWSVQGQENVDVTKTYVIVCNHQSAIDVLAVSQVRFSERKTFLYPHSFCIMPFLCLFWTT